jgi:hypothetical protein
MERTWSDGLCPDCKGLVKLDEQGAYRCACADKRWVGRAGVEGSAEDKALLESHGFQFAQDVRGDKYYVGSFSRLVWLYEDSTWAAWPRPSKEMSLDAYLTETDTL